MKYPDSLLNKVTRPARYCGGEWNSVQKDWEKAAIRFLLIYPDVYEIGMSNLAIQILYDILNKQSDVLCERTFSPWMDMEGGLRKSTLPLLSLENGRPLKQFDVIGFSLGYELTYTNVLNILDLAGIPVQSAERDSTCPLVIAGGSCCLNPEPLANFVDLFVIGEGEEVINELVDLLRCWKREGGSREDLLKQAAKIDGIYVPSLYDVLYNENGTVTHIEPRNGSAPGRVKRRIVQQLPYPPVRPLVPYLELVHDRAAIEIQRGCSRGCRFCQAGVIYRPVRCRPTDEVVKSAKELLQNTGYSELSLISLSTSDYPQIEELVKRLCPIAAALPLSISLPSLRFDSFSIGLMEALPSRKKSGLTFAPEAGSQRLRTVINKGLSQQSIIDTAGLAAERGWRNIKLYFMVGLPGETEADIKEIISLSKTILEAVRAAAGKQINLKISVTTFVPKAHTPFQWVPQEREEVLNQKFDILKAGLRRLGVSFSWQDPKVSLLEAVMARGDRRLGGVIYRAWKDGCRFDAWSEQFRFELWQEAFRKCGVAPSFYAHRQRPLVEVMPWNLIDTGVNEEFLKREYQFSLEDKETTDCAQGKCNACGLQGVMESCRRKLPQVCESSSVPCIKH